MKIAHLVDFSFLTRVVVPAHATEKQIMEAAIKQMTSRLENGAADELRQNVGSISKDTEMPYDPQTDD